jgi:hypothetical protein
MGDGPRVVVVDASGAVDTVAGVAVVGLVPAALPELPPPPQAAPSTATTARASAVERRPGTPGW